ncbi:MAG: phosphoribosylanthranilate isomerase [Elusimicrobiota bacterium]|jgi:phosphoribosylanthranilate isomerase|nr:phosphoribosylanthranilate isomerase [Elusimicrobiota bacterium]
MPKIKICGITNFKDALDATNLGADFLGFHTTKESVKKISSKLALDIILKLPPFVLPVAVFCNDTEQDVVKTIKKLKVKNVQFNGVTEMPDFCKNIRLGQNVKVFRAVKLESPNLISKLQDYKDAVDYFVLDVDFSNTQSFKENCDLIRTASEIQANIFVSGHIEMESIATVIKEAKPFGIEANNSIESLPKRKDHLKMSAFIKAAHGL